MDALPSTVWPVTVRPPVVEALLRVVCPDTVSLVIVVVASVEVPVTPRVPPIVSLPVIVEVPIVEELAVR